MTQVEEREGFARELMKKISEPTPLIDIAKRTGLSYGKITKIAESMELQVKKKQIMIPRYVMVIEKKEEEKKEDEENAR